MGFLKDLFAASRFVVVFAVIGTFVGSVVLLVMSALTVFRIAWQEIVDFDASKLSANHIDRLGVDFIKVIDITLLGTVLYIVSLGLYQLFIQHDLPLPQWLKLADLTDLKIDLIGVTVVLLGVTFLGEVVDWTGDGDILALGGAVALVIAALGGILWLLPRRQGAERPSEE